MGYPTDLFKDSDIVDEEFLCTICHEVFKDPTMTQGCEHIFCKSCIQDWRATSNNTCPIDRDPIVGLRPPFRAYMNLYNRLQMKCSFYGCSAESTLGELESHMGSCQYNPTTIKPCVHNCGASIAMKEIPTHICIEYLKEKLTSKEAENIGLKNDLQEQITISKSNEQCLLRKERDVRALEGKLRIKDKEIDTLRKEVGNKDRLINQLKKEKLQLERCRSEVTFKLEVEEISRLSERTLSPLFYARNLPWQVQVGPTVTSNKAKCLEVYLQCNGDPKYTNWSCKASATLRLCCFKPGGSDLQKIINQTYKSEECAWGSTNFTLWSLMMDPNKGFVQNGKIILEVELNADPPVFNK